MSAPAYKARQGSGPTWAGRAIRRVEDRALLLGQGRFTADLRAAWTVRFIRSPVPSGRIVSVTAPNGAHLFTSADISSLKPIRPMLHKFGYVPIAQSILASGEVRFVGEPIACVVAESAEAAEDIAEDVTFEIDALPSVIDAQGALAIDAPRVHASANSNVVVEGSVETPGFAQAAAGAIHIVSVNVRSQRQNAAPLEARAAHASFDPVTGRITLTCTTQMPHLVRTAVCDLIGMPESDLRVVAPDVGGGFGQKMALAPEYVMVAWLARHFESSVAWAEDRRENLMAGFHSRDQYLALEGGFDAQGKLVALSADVVANVGAYSCFPTTCGVEPLMALAEMPGPYNVQAYRCRSRGVVTHTCPMAPYRGVSRPAITFAMERLMDKAAVRLAIEPTEIRRGNLIAKFPYTSATGLVFDEGTYCQTLDIASDAVDLAGFRTRQQTARAQGRYLGIGFATFSERTGYGTPAFAARGMEITPGWETVELSMDPSGFVEARIGASPHGQGLRTTLTQLIADELALPLERIKVVHGDTDRTPYGWGTFASRSLVISGGATVRAARKLRAKLTAIASHELEAAPDDIVLDDGFASVAGTDRRIAIGVLARHAYHQIHRYGADLEPGLIERATYDPSGTFSNACHVAIVDVDIETGGVKLERFVVAEDAGRLINPMIADGQVHGGVAQGIGNALLEEIVYDEGGNILTTTLADYLPPTAHEVPLMEIQHIETHTEASLTKAKGLGEGGTIGAPAAIVNAINDALRSFGVEIDEMPATPRRILAALRSAAGEIK